MAVLFDVKTFIRSNEFDSIFKELITLKNPSISKIQRKWGLSFQKAKRLYEEVQLYSGDVYLQDALFELKHEYEPLTITRIMGRLNISYLLAEKLFQMYMEDY